MPVSTAYKKFSVSCLGEKVDSAPCASQISPSHCCETSAHFFISFKLPLGGEVATRVGNERGWQFLRDKGGGRQTKPLKCFGPQFRLTAV